MDEIETLAQSDKRIAIIIGATGLVGKSLLAKALASTVYDRVLVLVRRQMTPQQLVHRVLDPHELLKLEVIEVEFDHLENFKGTLAGRLKHGAGLSQDWFCGLGTTIKVAGSQEQFRKVDYEYVFRLACLSQELGGDQFLVISSMGADAVSRMFYAKVKGEMESALWDLQMRNLFIFRPSMLLGKRSEFRAGEKIVTWLTPVLTPFLIGGLRAYRPIHADVVAQAMLNVACSQTTGPQIFLSDYIEDIGTGAVLPT